MSGYSKIIKKRPWNECEGNHSQMIIFQVGASLYVNVRVTVGSRIYINGNNLSWVSGPERFGETAHGSALRGLVQYVQSRWKKTRINTVWEASHPLARSLHRFGPRSGLFEGYHRVAPEGWRNLWTSCKNRKWKGHDSCGVFQDMWNAKSWGLGECGMDAPARSVPWSLSQRSSGLDWDFPLWSPIFIL